MNSNKQQQIHVQVTPRFPGAPRKTSTVVDFLVEIVPPEPLKTTGTRAPLNIALAIDTSGSMNEVAYQEPGNVIPGRWAKRPIWNYPITTYGDNIFKPQQPVWPNQPSKPCDIPGMEWYWVPESYSGGRTHSKMEYAIKAAHAAIDALTEEDRISVVSFNSTTHIVFPSSFATAENKRKCKMAVSTLTAGGGTHLHDGWKKAAEQVCMHLAKDSVNRVLLLTDGQPSDQMRNPQVLKQHCAGLAEHSVTTSTFGVGLSFSEDLLQAMAEGGDGRYYYLDNANLMAERFDEEFLGMSQLMGRQVSLQFATGKGIRVEQCLNSLEMVGNRIKLANAVRGHRQQLILRCHVDGSPKEGWELTATCSWRDTEGAEHTVETEYMLPAVTEAKFKSMKENPRVGERAAELEIAIAQQEAMKALDAGDILRSRGILEATAANAVGSAYASVQGQASKLMAFTAMANNGDTQNLRKSVYYDMYETSNSRTTNSQS